ncbi:MAG: YbjQ family protein [SAR202 cluster bacterium]|nr:YbjQ family protein [SAR202 cluster bacterium]MDP6713605.1 YbjQ family protein [SAR202 cluster bacterium]
MIITSTDEIEGMEIKKVLGLVRGNSVRARHVGRDITALFRNIVGGELPEYTRLMAESREVATERMIGRAKELGANAIVATRYMTSAIMSGASEILVYGTAVLVEDD